MSRVIHVEGLSKKFSLHHLASGENYSTFRDALATGLSRASKKLLRRQKEEDKETNEEFWALQDIGFTIHSGEKVGIIGRNGAGKSTLLKILSRIIEPTRGEIRIRGRVASLLEVGTGFHPELTGRENIYFNGAVLGMTKSEIRKSFDAIVAFAEVEKFLDTPVKHYSSGMYVRLGFAVAAHLEPEILIVDEVLAVGDVRFQKKCLGKLQEIGNTGRTVLFVSHNMSSILQFTDRVLLLQTGRIIQDGDTESGVRSYLRVNEDASQAVNLVGKLPWFRIKSIAFEQTRMEVGFNKPLRLRLEIATDRNLGDIDIELSIINSIGARIVTTRAVLTSIIEGVHSYKLIITDHRLIPGTYFVSMIIRRRVEILFTQEQVLALELVTDEIEDPSLAPFLTRGKDRFGCFCNLAIEESHIHADT